MVELRGVQWLCLGIITLVLASGFDSSAIGDYIWILTKLTGAAYIGYWAHRTLIEKGSRPHLVENLEAKDRMKFRRVLIMSAFVVGSALVL